MTAPPRYPLFLDLAGRPCAVVGAGTVAERKVAGLLACGARVTVVAPEACPALAARARAGEGTWTRRGFEPGDLDGTVLAFAATSDPAVNQRVRAEARRRGVWVNVADDPGGSGFHVPAVVRRGAVAVAVATGGASPALAAWVRDRVAEAVPPAVGEVADLARRLRDMARHRVLGTLLNDGIVQDLERGDRRAAARKVLARAGEVPGWTARDGPGKETR